VERFLVKYADAVIGSLSGFDRLVFRGTLRTLCHRFGVLRGRLDPDHPGTRHVLTLSAAMLSHIDPAKVLVSSGSGLAMGW